MISPENRSGTEWFWQRSAIRDIVQLMNDSPTESAVGTVHAGGPVEDRFCTVPMAAAERLGFLLAAVGGGIDELAQGPLAELGLDHHDYTVLAILAVDGPGAQSDIAKLMNKAPGVIVAAVDQLESKGFVQRQRDPADRRRSRVTPTKAGLKALAAADKVGDQLAADALGGLSAAEIGSLHALLKRGLGLEP
jgi:MarR family transcriptional regulator, lower aerobic nicotinate degradation pathway regulator